MESEKDVERYLVEQVEAIGGLCRKYVSPGVRGVPDRLCFMPGAFLMAVELKSETEEPTTQQEREHTRIRSCGFKVYVVDTKVKVDKLLREWIYEYGQTD